MAPMSTSVLLVFQLRKFKMNGFACMCSITHPIQLNNSLSWGSIVQKDEPKDALLMVPANQLHYQEGTEHGCARELLVMIVVCCISQNYLIFYVDRFLHVLRSLL